MLYFILFETRHSIIRAGKDKTLHRESYTLTSNEMLTHLLDASEKDQICLMKHGAWSWGGQINLKTTFILTLQGRWTQGRIEVEVHLVKERHKLEDRVAVADSFSQCLCPNLS